MKQPHIHAEVIKAYAAGETIETKVGERWEAAPYPRFFVDVEYRVKPDPLCVVETLSYGNSDTGMLWSPRGVPAIGQKVAFTCDPITKRILAVELLD